MNTLLDVQSSHSLLWGTASPLDMLRRAGELGYTSLAITDHANLYALPSIVRAMKGLACRPIFGASFPNRSCRTAALIEDATGYANLCRIITRWHSEPKETRESCLVACLDEMTSGLIFLSDDEAVLRHLREREAACFYRVGRSLAQPPAWVRELGLKTAFAPDVAMLRADEYEVHRLLRTIGTGGLRDTVSPDVCCPPSAFLHPPEHYARTFAIYADAMRTSEAIAERAQFVPTQATIFPPCPTRDRPAIQELREHAYAGAVTRYGELSEAVTTRMEYELGLIEQNGFAEYFLVVEDIVKASPRTCGRGSGAASLVNYCLGVTNVDPIRYNLMFERFLNPGRIDPPDIDIDFAWDERDDVLDYAFQKYGHRQAAMVCNHLTFQPRMAIRETARAFGIPDDEITAAVAQLPISDYVYHAKPDRMLPPVSLRQEPWPEILRLATRLVGLPRLLSLHCGGIVIVPGELSAHVPVETSAKGLPMIQWEKDGTEDMGLVKIDLLGNRSLAVIRDAVRSVATAKGIAEADVIPIVPADDPATCALMAEGRTMGVFYVESPAMRLLQQKAKRGDFEHLVIHSSIIRPAANSFINEYLERLHGKPWEPLHPRLAGVFDETYGVVVYQEDVCKLAMALAGFDSTRADQLRKCLGKRDAAERLAQHKIGFYDGGRALGVTDDVLDLAWESIMSMTGYSFCKPHSASYAQVSYESAYLKAHHAAHFMAAVISNGGGFYSTQAYISEAMRLGLRVYLPCVNASAWAFTEENGGIRVGLMAIKGLAKKTADRILHERQHGPYTSLSDFTTRTNLPPEELHRLAVIGAFDAVAPMCNRPQIMWLLRQGQASKPSRTTGTLFDMQSAPRVPKLPAFTSRQRMEAEYAALGFLVGAHPLALYENMLRRIEVPITPSSLISSMGGKTVTLIGWPVTGKIVSTKHNEAMQFFSFEDAHGIYETVLFPKTYNRFAKLLHIAQPLLVTGTIQLEFDTPTVNITRILATSTM